MSDEIMVKLDPIQFDAHVRVLKPEPLERVYSTCRYPITPAAKEKLIAFVRSLGYELAGDNLEWTPTEAIRGYVSWHTNLPRVFVLIDGEVRALSFTPISEEAKAIFPAEGSFPSSFEQVIDHLARVSE